jgi:HK97 family phage major capsid protein
VIPTGTGTVNPLRQMSRVETITGTTWLGVTSTGITASFDAQAAEVSDDAPTLGQPSITPAKAQAFVPFSIEIEQDWSGLSGELTKMLAVAKDDLEATQFVTGTGSDAPYGVMTGATTTLGTASAGAFAIADVYATEAALGARFRKNAAWLSNKYFYNLVRQFDTAGGAGLWMRLPQGTTNSLGETDTTVGAELIGYPAYESTAINTGNVLTSGTNIAVFGDFANQFVIVDRLGMTVELVPHLFATGANRPDGQRGLYAYWRTSSKVITAGAFRKLQTIY